MSTIAEADAVAEFATTAGLRTRYLTPEGKRWVLDEWARKRAEMPHTGPGDGGHGLPDPEVFPWCDALNEIPGVCTLQSCAGHVVEAADGSGPYRYPGEFWVWLDQPMSAAFDRHALQLAAKRPHIEKVTKLYGDWGQEVVSIIFAGDALHFSEDAMRLIVGFFRWLHESAHRA